MLPIPSLGDEEGVMHYHIRWSNSKVDWQAFRSPAEANASARQLARQDEAYAVEKFEGKCWRCAQITEFYRQMRTKRGKTK